MCIRILYFLQFIVIGDMGGYLGLLIGASVVTIFEVLDLIIDTAINKLFGRKKKKKRRRQRDQRGDNIV